jgi:hypothetical protein
MSTDAINTPIEMPGWATEEVSIRWTRLADGSYLKELGLFAKRTIPQCSGNLASRC